MINKEKIKGIILKALFFVRKRKIYYISIILLLCGFFYNDYSYRKRKIENIRNANNLQTKLFLDINLENKSLKDKRNYLLRELPDDIIIGSKNAKVSIIDYSSYTCQFCKQLRKEINEAISFFDKEKQGLVKYTLRPVANKKTILLNVFLSCYTGNKKELAEEFFNIKWLEISDIREYLNTTIENKKLNKKEMFNCLNSDEYFKRNIYYQRESDMVFNVIQTPLLIINGKKYYGYKNKNELIKIISKYVAEN